VLAAATACADDPPTTSASPAPSAPAARPAPSPSASGGCGPGQVPADLRLPSRVEDLDLAIFDAAGRAGLDARVAEDFRERRVPARAAGAAPTRSDTTVVRYGPEAVGAAQLVRAYLLDNARPEFAIDRPGRTVDVVLGADFQRLAGRTEVNQALAMLGAPSAPPGTCGVPR